MYVTSKASAKISNDFKIRKSNIHDAVNCLQHLLFRNLNSTKCSSEKLQILQHILCIRKKIHAYTTNFKFVFHCADDRNHTILPQCVLAAQP